MWKYRLQSIIGLINEISKAKNEKFYYCRKYSCFDCFFVLHSLVCLSSNQKVHQIPWIAFFSMTIILICETIRMQRYFTFLCFWLALLSFCLLFSIKATPFAHGLLLVSPTEAHTRCEFCWVFFPSAFCWRSSPLPARSVT